MKSKLNPTGHHLIVCNPKCPDEVTVDLLGGYRAEDDGKTTVVMFRYHGRTGLEDRDAAFLLFGKNRGFVVPENIELCADSGDWDRFAELPVGARFRLAERWWIKASIPSLKKKMHERIVLL